MQQSAVRMYTNGPKRDASDVNKLPDYRQAQEDLKQAKTYFEDLMSKGSEITKIDKARIAVHVKYCTEHFEKSELFVTAAEDEAQIALTKRSQEAARRSQAEAVKAQAAAEKRKAEEEKKNSLNEQSLSAYDEKRQEMLRKWKESGPAIEVSKKRKLKGKARPSKGAARAGDLAEEDNEIEEDEEEDEQVDPNVLLEENLFGDEEVIDEVMDDRGEEEDNVQGVEGDAAVSDRRLQRNDQGGAAGEEEADHEAPDKNLFDD